MSVRVVLVAACPFPSPQGSQVFVGGMAAGLAARGHDVHLLTYGQGREVSDQGYHHHRLRRLWGDDALRSGPSPAKPLLDVMLAVRLYGLVRKLGIEVVHAHNYEAAVAALAVSRLLAVPVVYHSHNLMVDELPSYFVRGFFRAIGRRVGSLLDRSVPRRADHAIALCDYTAAALRDSGVSASRLSVIPPAVGDVGLRGPMAQARERLGIEPAAAVVGYCGNLDGYQNMEVLLQAVAVLRTRNRSRPAILLVVTHAADPGFERAVAAAGLAGSVRVEVADGFSAALRGLEAADVVVLPRREGSGYPIKLLNYMAMAMPIVTAGCGGKVLDDGVDALVVGDDDAPAMAYAIESLLADPRRALRLGDGARRHYMQSLTWEAVLPAIEGVYHEVLTGGARSTAPSTL